jgi:hypothetical protein
MEQRVSFRFEGSHGASAHAAMNDSDDGKTDGLKSGSIL